ncbi:MAG: peptidoglycan bridge formation glycyltransferase FemA/FemB family protein [Patescibacteria group bacterium]|nr:peptidoglycan bridge formation glycyltransferase FemA/FemB family protein [Patescibacteria group bacterium]
MPIKEIDNKEIWDEFVASRKGSQFLQSFSWGEFKKNLGRVVKRFIFIEDNKIKMAALVIKKELSFGNNYLYCPRGPVLAEDLLPDEKTEIIDEFIEKIKEWAQKDNSVFLKIEPPLIRNEENINFDKLGLSSGESVQPPDTVILNLEKSEEEILKQMHSKTRYNIRLAIRKGVRVEFSTNQKDIEKFYKLVKVVNQREGISSFSLEYYKKMFEVFLKDNNILLAKGLYKGEVIVMNLIIFYGDTAVYNHGASSNKYRNVMAPHLAHWETIKKAKKRGLKFYDLRGIAPSDDPKHKWAGLTRFKKGFSKDVVNYVGGYDLVFKPFLYQLYSLGKKFR